MEANRWTICLGLTTIKCSFHPFVEQSFYFKVEVSKSKTIKNKTANRSKKMKTAKKMKYLWMCLDVVLYKPLRSDRISDHLFKTERNCKSKY